MNQLTKDGAGQARRQNWKQDPERVQRDIIEVATRVFADQGFAKARIEDIAAQTETSKRMVYYYFGDKQGLYAKVLEAAYLRMGQGESETVLDAMAPDEALRRVITFQFDHHRKHPEFIRLLMVENIQNARTLRETGLLEQHHDQARAVLDRIYRRGVAEGVFRPGIDPLKLRLMLSGVSFFNVSNRPSFTALFGDRLWGEEEQQALREMLVETLLTYVMTPAAPRAEAEPQKDERMINPEIHPFLATWDEKWAALKPDATPADRRKRFEVIAHEMRLPTPEDVETEAVHWIESPSGPVRVRVFRHNSGGVQPCLIYMHGGGWMQGSPETHWDITARFASFNRQTVISVDYAKAPEEPFPAAFNQCLAVTRWTHANADMLGIDPAKIAIGGDSAGGNLAAAVAVELLGSDVPLLAQVLVYPSCDFDRTRPSYLENPDGPLVKPDGKVEAMYCPNPADKVSPRVQPLLAESHAGLPPAYIAVAEHDPLRDSGRAYAEALTKAGVSVELSQGEGLIHGYLRAMEFCDASRQSLAAMAAWLNARNEA